MAERRRLISTPPDCFVKKPSRFSVWSVAIQKHNLSVYENSRPFQVWRNFDDQGEQVGIPNRFDLSDCTEPVVSDPGQALHKRHGILSDVSSTSVRAIRARSEI